MSILGGAIGFCLNLKRLLFLMVMLVRTFTNLSLYGFDYATHSLIIELIKKMNK